MPLCGRQIVANALVPLLLEACADPELPVLAAAAGAFPSLCETLLASYIAEEDAGLLATKLLDVMRSDGEEANDAAQRHRSSILSSLCLLVPVAPLRLVVCDLCGIRGESPLRGGSVDSRLFEGRSCSALLALARLYEGGARQASDSANKECPAGPRAWREKRGVLVGLLPEVIPLVSGHVAHLASQGALDFRLHQPLELLQHLLAMMEGTSGEEEAEEEGGGVPALSSLAGVLPGVSAVSIGLCSNHLVGPTVLNGALSLLLPLAIEDPDHIVLVAGLCGGDASVEKKREAGWGWLLTDIETRLKVGPTRPNTAQQNTPGSSTQRGEAEEEGSSSVDPLTAGLAARLAAHLLTGRLRRAGGDDPEVDDLVVPRLLACLDAALASPVATVLQNACDAFGACVGPLGQSRHAGEARRLVRRVLAAGGHSYWLVRAKAAEVREASPTKRPLRVAPVADAVLCCGLRRSEHSTLAYATPSAMSTPPRRDPEVPERRAETAQGAGRRGSRASSFPC